MNELIKMTDHNPEAGAVKKRGRPLVPVYMRLDAKVAKAGPDDCWYWQGAANTYGYGYLRVDGKSLRVTRLVLERHIGRQLKEGEHATHLCNNPACCNPKHLIVGTHKENMEYKVQCDRQAKGEKIGLSKLTAAGVIQIISLLSEGHLSQRQMGKMMGVNQKTISFVNTGKTWTHVCPEVPRPIRRKGW